MTAVTSVGAMSIVQRLQWVGLAVLCLSTVASAIKCFDCVGEDCVGSFCEGQYCMLSKFAPRWGSAEWGAPQTVKGCMSGTMLRDDVRDHCEANLEDGIEVFTCFCNKDYCNGPKQVRKLKIEPVELYTCVCNGEHCEGKTCIGKFCTYVVNHNNKKTEQGCVNVSIPLIERRTLGACMMPPITGAMHHSIAEEVEDLLNTESCTCASDYCNFKKPVIEVERNMKCKMNVRANLMGAEMNSSTITFVGEYCFSVNVISELGYMRSFETIGCVSFIEGSELAEELEVSGCGKFQSEKLTVNACLDTKDTKALARAKVNVQSKHQLVTAAP
uniref:Uncharacterized protein n=1 Tax=Plectus sambesii TaxID=2011161 RepID=A0A914X9F0_9BILA